MLRRFRRSGSCTAVHFAKRNIETARSGGPSFYLDSREAFRTLRAMVASIRTPVIVSVSNPRPISAIGTNLRGDCSFCAATLLGLSRISCTPYGVHTMTAAYDRTRSSRSLAHKGRMIAQGHPYVVTAAATVGALAISALVNRRLAKKAESDNPPLRSILGGKWRPAPIRRTRFRGAAGSIAWQWQHDSGFSIQRVDRFSLQELSSHRF